MAWLRILSGRGEGSTFNIGERTFTAGRSPGNLVQLLARDVSRRHCQFRWDGVKYVIQDLNSENGVLGDGERVTEHPLDDGDQIAIGKTVLQFRAGDQMPGAVDHAQRWKEVRAELTGASTATLDQNELSGMLGALRQELNLDPTPAPEPVPVPASSSPSPHHPSAAFP
jgi:pSer/pThr/pTyr-binding forkhead associated (FHA) protein